MPRKKSNKSTVLIPSNAVPIAHPELPVGHPYLIQPETYRVFRAPHIDRAGRQRPSAELSVRLDGSGYNKVSLVIAACKQKDFFLHQLIAFTFIEGFFLQEGEVVRHLNDIKNDNSLDNLIKGKHVSNKLDSLRNGGTASKSSYFLHVGFDTYKNYTKPWRARIQIKSKLLHSKAFQSDFEAATAADLLIIENNSSNNRNFPCLDVNSLACLKQEDHMSYINDICRLRMERMTSLKVA